MPRSNEVEMDDVEHSSGSNRVSKAPSEADEDEYKQDTAPGTRKRSNAASYWSAGEKQDFVRLLGQHGRDYARISQEIPNKTATQCRNVGRS